MKESLYEEVRRHFGDLIFISKFATPNPFRKKLPMNPEFQTYHDLLVRDGIFSFRTPETIKIAEHLKVNYFDKFDKTQDLESINYSSPERRFNIELTDRGTNSGYKYISSISFQDKDLRPLLCHEQLMNVIGNYYGRNFYYRNQPSIQKVDFSLDDKARDTGKWHIDPLHQVSIMIYASDVEETDTHTEYRKGSHRRRRIGRVRLTREEVDNDYNNWPNITKALGKAGTVFVFDTFGYHRAFYQTQGKPRRLMHLNITTGHNIKKFGEDLTGWPHSLYTLFDKVRL